MSENGSHVSRAELQAHLQPMRADIADIRGDVKQLLLYWAGETGVRKANVDRSRKRTTAYVIGATIIAGVMGALGSVLGGLLS